MAPAGWLLGRPMAGFEHEVVLDNNLHAFATLKKNRDDGVRYVKNWNIINGDVLTHDFRQYKTSIDVIFGGPPCQPFSLGGRHRSFSDGRNMFPEAIRAVRETRPRAFMFENVRGLLRPNFNVYFEYIIEQLAMPDLLRMPDEDWREHSIRLKNASRQGQYHDIQYDVFFKCLNAADFGVPQKRERVFIVGIRKDLKAQFVFPGVDHSEDALFYQQWVSKEYWERHKIPLRKQPSPPARLEGRIREISECFSSLLGKPWRTVRDAIQDLPMPSNGGEVHLRDHYVVPGARSYPGHTGSILDAPAKTLKAGDHGVPGGENTLCTENGSVRYFSVRECARLQTFPDDWIFMGSWKETMRQLGNAVPVDLARAVALQLANSLLEVRDLAKSRSGRSVHDQF